MSDYDADSPALLIFYPYILGQNICRLVNNLVQFLLPLVKQNKIIITRKWMFELPHELPNDLELLGIDGEYPAGHSIRQISTALKNFIEKPI